MIHKKLKMIVDSMPLSDPNITDIRVVRAIDKKRCKLYSFMPYLLYSESLRFRSFRRVFKNSFSEKRTKKDEPGSVALTSHHRNQSDNN